MNIVFETIRPLDVARFGFWVSVVGILSTYVLYPIGLICLQIVSRRRRSLGNASPSVALIISAFNEEAVICEKLENSLEIDYPSDRFMIAVLSDASTDRTDSLTESYADRGVRLFRQGSRRGKSAALTEFVPQVVGDILVFSDANSMYDRSAIRKLARHFSDPTVGYVVGHQGYVEESGAAVASESLYWRYETWLKDLESRTGSVVGGDGAIFAVRREHFRPLRDDDINDFVLPLMIVRDGFRGVFDRSAVCYERAAAGFQREFHRKVRIVNRSFRAICRVPETLNPLRVGFFAYQLFFHKVLRWFVPFLLLVLLVTSVYLAGRHSPFYSAALACQLIFYSLALSKFIPKVGSAKPCYVAYYFCLVNAAAALGILAFLAGKRYTTWQPQRSEAEGSAVV